MQRLLIIAALIAAATLAFLYFPAKSDPDPEPVATVPAASEVSSSSGGILGYDSNVAMNLSGELVPPEVEGYYFIEILDDAPNAEYLLELRDLLARTHADSDYLGVIGRDAGRVRRLLLEVLREAPAGSLSEATIVMIGRAQDEPALRPVVEASGAKLRFGIYISPDTPIL